jgi:hypothetical protein
MHTYHNLPVAYGHYSENMWVHLFHSSLLFPYFLSKYLVIYLHITMQHFCCRPTITSLYQFIGWQGYSRFLHYIFSHFLITCNLVLVPCANMWVNHSYVCDLTNGSSVSPFYWKHYHFGGWSQFCHVGSWLFDNLTAFLQGVRFSMPLCTTEVEEATEDDLIEFSKIQTLNLGQVPFAS